VRSPHRLKCFEQRVVGCAGSGQQGFALGAFYLGEREKKVLGRDELVAEVFRVGLGFIEDLVQLSGERGLRVRLFWEARHLATDRLAKLRNADAELLEDGNDDAFILREEREEQMKVVDERIARAAREINRFIQGVGRFYGEPIWIDH
jgi:hypothetical protein